MNDKKLQSIIKEVVRREFYKNQENFRNEAMDECDLEQEGYILADKILKNPRYKNATDDEKEWIIRKSLMRHFNKISVKSQGRREVAETMPNPTKGDEDEISDDEYFSSISIKIHVVNHNELLLDDLKQICTDEEIEILRQKYAEDKTLEGIGKAHDVSESRMSQKLKEIKAKLRKHGFLFISIEDQIGRSKLYLILKIFKKN